MATFGWEIRDEWDNGEFMSGCTVDLIEDGRVVESKKFVVSEEFADNDGSARVQAASYAEAWRESREYTIEERLGPFGLEWEREHAERSFGEVPF